MNITDIILVTENHNGSERNMLMDFMDFLEFIDKDSWLSRKELAEDMALLGRTCGGKEKWLESYFTEDKAVSAKYCADRTQLEVFLQGCYNTDEEWKFDEQSCSENCLDCLNALGINTDKRSGQEYGTSGQMKMDEHRSRLQNQFSLFYTLSRNELATDNIKIEATKAMYEEFGTGRRELFMKNLEGGKYDSGFVHGEKQQRAR